MLTGPVRAFEAGTHGQWPGLVGCTQGVVGCSHAPQPPASPTTHHLVVSAKSHRNPPESDGLAWDAAMPGDEPPHGERFDWHGCLKHKRLPNATRLRTTWRKEMRCLRGFSQKSTLPRIIGKDFFAQGNP